MIPDPLKKSVTKFLDQVSQNLFNNGCNDWNFSKSEIEAARKFLDDPEAGTNYRSRFRKFGPSC